MACTLSAYEMQDLIQNKLEYLKNFPDDVAERIELGQIYVEQYQYDDAADQFMIVLLDDPHNIKAWTNLLAVLNYTGSDNDVISLRNLALDNTDNDPLIAFIIASSLERKSNRLNAISLLKSIIDDSRTDENTAILCKLKLAQSYYSLGDFYRYNIINNELKKAQTDENKKNENIVKIKPLFLTELSFNKENNDVLNQKLKQYVDMGALEMEIYANSRLQDSKVAANTYSLDIKNKYFFLTVDGQFHLIKSNKDNFPEDENAFGTLFTASKQFYFNKYRIEPFASIGFCEYKATEKKEELTQINAGFAFSSDSYTILADLNRLNDSEKKTSAMLTAYANIYGPYSIQSINSFGYNYQFTSTLGGHFDKRSASHQFHQIDNLFSFKQYVFNISYCRSLHDKWTNTWGISASIFH